MYKKILCIFLLALVLLGTGCKRAPKEIKEMESGVNVSFESKHVSISDSYSLKADKKSDFYTGLKIYISVSGYKELSYYNAELYVKINYDALNESGGYHTYYADCMVTLSPKGNGFYRETIETPGFRNIKNVVFIYSSSGSVTRL